MESGTFRGRLTGDDAQTVSCVRLGVVIRGVSPIIVRTIDVPPQASSPMLNDVLPACFNWSGECLHEFEVRGRCCSHLAFVSAEPSQRVTVESLGLRLGERFE